MSRDNNSGRPKKPRSSTRNNSDGSRASKSGSSSGSKPFKKSFPKAGERNSDSRRSGDTSYQARMDKKYSKTEQEPFISSPGEEKKPFGKPTPQRGGSRAKSFDTRDKYERGSLKYGRRPSADGEERQDKAKSFVQKRRLTKIDKEIHKDTIRLNKYIANSGICSRREADELIVQGLVEVNGKVVTEMGYQVEKTDKVVFDGQNITPEKPVYVLLNKPKGYISTTKDDKARKTVMDLVANASPYRLFPVGRLDRSTTGVILLTNDGHMTKKLTHPSFDAKKIYHVTLDKKLSHEDLKLIAEGIRLDEGVAVVDQISFIEGKPKNEVGIEIHIGWNRVIRRIFQRLGYEVEALDRVMFAGLTKKNIKRGHWRILTELEVNNLKML
ncbi:MULTISPECIES: pseudouridine synthase [Chryseobacterium]|uniref:Pseudouridine synthase n=1 Tax=Chryseobacterium geocarposphaerae TaxID=1416776 RepID=A0ABU1LFM6_9FLAO|nr:MULTISPECIES: pseudouridine synthase [Chryseobacterium]MDR6405521.1 23S rRNA pseudouridine2605 synthase [Chryseobacterium geocarposphaerae]MDR6698752.1 23S rRNA pseudouridine2605 synthase [Chryseobacterium ginsenosidimutans]